MAGYRTLDERWGAVLALLIPRKRRSAEAPAYEPDGLVAHAEAA